jgi:hypothetical protein
MKKRQAAHETWVEETRSSRRFPPDAEDVPNVDDAPVSTPPSPAARPRGDAGAKLGHEALALETACVLALAASGPARAAALALS